MCISLKVGVTCLQAWMGGSVTLILSNGQSALYEQFLGGQEVWHTVMAGVRFNSSETLAALVSVVWGTTCLGLITSDLENQCAMIVLGIDRFLCANYSRQSLIPSFWCCSLEGPATSCHICAITGVFQTAPVDICVLVFLSWHCHLIHKLFVFIPAWT